MKFETILILTLIAFTLCDNKPRKKLVGYTNDESSEMVLINDDASYLSVLNTLLEKYDQVKLFDAQSNHESTFMAANKTQAPYIENYSDCDCYCNSFEMCDELNCCFNTIALSYYKCEVAGCCISSDGLNNGCPLTSSASCNYECDK